MKTPGLAAVLALPLLAGCTAPATNSPASGKERTKTVVLLVDFSGSSSAFRDTYRDAFPTITTRLQAGDAVAAFPINGASLGSAPGVLVSLDIETTEQPNDLLRRKEEKRIRAEVSARKEQIESRLAEFVSQPAKAKKTEILAGLQNAGKVIRQLGRERAVIVVFSDMVEESQALDLSRAVPSGERAAKWLEEARQKGLVPDLQGAEIYVVAPSGAESSQWSALQGFWSACFRVAGASLRPENYSSSLPAFRE